MYLPSFHMTKSQWLTSFHHKQESLWFISFFLNKCQSVPLVCTRRRLRMSQGCCGSMVCHWSTFLLPRWQNVQQCLHILSPMRGWQNTAVGVSLSKSAAVSNWFPNYYDLEHLSQCLMVSIWLYIGVRVSHQFSHDFGPRVSHHFPWD